MTLKREKNFNFQVFPQTVREVFSPGCLSSGAATLRPRLGSIRCRLNYCGSSSGVTIDPVATDMASLFSISFHSGSSRFMLLS